MYTNPPLSFTHIDYDESSSNYRSCSFSSNKSTDKKLTKKRFMFYRSNCYQTSQFVGKRALLLNQNCTFTQLKTFSNQCLRTSHKKTLNTRLSLKTFQPYDLFRFHKTAKKKSHQDFSKSFSFTGSLQRGSVY